MWIEYTIQANQIQIISKSDTIIDSNNNVAFSNDFDSFNDFVNRFNRNTKPSFIANTPSKVWVEISQSESDQIYNWYLLEDWVNIFKRHNQNKYSELTYCCSRHKDIVRENLQRLGYGV